MNRYFLMGLPKYFVCATAVAAINSTSAFASQYDIQIKMKFSTQVHAFQELEFSPARTLRWHVGSRDQDWHTVLCQTEWNGKMSIRSGTI